MKQKKLWLLLRHLSGSSSSTSRTSNWDLPGAEAEVWGDRLLAQDQGSHGPGPCWGGGQSVPLVGRVPPSAAGPWGWSTQSSREMTQPHVLWTDSCTWNVPSGMAVEEKKWQPWGEKKDYSIRVLYDSKRLGKKWMQGQSDIQMFSIYKHDNIWKHLDSKWKGLCFSTCVAHLGKLQPGTSLVKRELINCCHIPHRVTWDWIQRLDLAGLLFQQARAHTNIHTCH